MLAVPNAVLSQTTIDDLQRQLTDRDAEIQRLRQRIVELEAQAGMPQPSRELRPRGPEPLVLPAPSAAAASSDEDEEGDRALERALVRQGGLLLRRGTVEFEPNFQYSHQSTESTNFRRDAFGPAIAARVGLPWDLQLDLSVPYVFEHRRNNSGSSRADGVGDISLGLSHQFVDEAEVIPAIIGSVGYTFATGDNSQFSNVAAPVGLGAGFDAAQAGFTAVKRVDPLVYFGSYTFSHSFSGEQAGNSVDLGNSHGFRLGTLLAASPYTSLRAAFNVTFFDKTQFNGQGLSGTDEPSALLEFGGAVLVSPSSLLDVGVGAGLTRSAPDFRFSVAYPIRF